MDALCKRYCIDNAHRQLHGALLDAELLARVYLAMTGGQNNLFAESHLHSAVPGRRPLVRHAADTVNCYQAFMRGDMKKKYKRKLKRKKINISISLKVTLIVFILSASIILSLTYINIQNQQNFFIKNYSNRASAIARSFDASIKFHDIVNDTTQLQGFVVSANASNEELMYLSINMPDPDDS